jgi:predicted metal-dependent hydrolase
MHLQLKNIGNVHFVQSHRARRLRITLRPFRGIRVSVPAHISLTEAKHFVESKQDWILKQLPKMEAMEAEILAAREREEKINVHEACEHLYQRLILLAEKHNFRFNRITFRNQKTRWGSCSAKNNLNLNINLFKLPQVLQDYVILHELVHTRVKNHSPQFWQELEKVLPGAKELNKQLRKYKILAL